MSEKKTENVPKTMGFLSHLIELRDRLLRIVIAVGVVFFILFPFSKTIYTWLADPLLKQGGEMIITGPIAPFLVPMKLTLLVAFLVTLPYLFYQLWSFVAPGLYKHEKRLVYPLLASSVLLFYLGILFVYYILLPMMFQIIPQFAPEGAIYSPDIGQYLDFTMMMFIAFGFGFEMPIATILLISTGMTTAETLRSKRPYVIVAAFIIGMLLTPPDVVSQVMLAVPMWILFELGLYFSKFFSARIDEAGKAREEMDREDESGFSTATGTAALSAEELWQDDNYHYEEVNDEENDVKDVNDDENTILNPEEHGSDSSVKDDDSDADNDADNDANNDTHNNNAPDNEDFKPLSDEEMEAELDRIEAEEKAEESEEAESDKPNDQKPNKK